MPTLTQTIDLLRQVLQIPNADSLIPDNDIMSIVEDLAINRFSEVRPREFHQDYIGNSEYNVALPSSWQDNLSAISNMFIQGAGQDRGEIDPNEYEVIPVDDSTRGLSNVSNGANSITLSTVANAGYFKNDDIIRIGNSSTINSAGETNWCSADGNASTGVITLKNATAAAYSSTPVVKKIDHIRFYRAAPTSSETFVVNYGGLHTHDEDTDTVETADYNAFVNLCAALVAESIAAGFSKHTAPSFNADAVDYGTLAQQWQERADKHLVRFNEHFGIGNEAQAHAAGAFQDLDLKFTHGKEFLFHGGRYR